ncbi:hypothetical protein DL546_006629 [Coniochaeta pulveracea]|uniref:Uncharacterized protein n=1 Tax=Coniochaeta pulveracea TaxID=177199 RepID=A0A420YFS8_9PEZI|nr:hypothetical protein DL546_006629 [Coniochaeta pulveracea]
MSSLPTEELEQLLTPALLTHLVKCRLPYPGNAGIDFVEFGRNIFLADPFGPMVKDTVWPVLLVLSKIGTDNMPDLSTFLPPPSDPAYPEQCLGLSLLLDNVPRLLFRGMDQRWTFGYFDKICQRLAETWHSLPASERPDSWSRWQNMGYGLDYWIGVRFWFGCAFAHSEELHHQMIALKSTEETRCVVESMTGQTDPYRGLRKEILSDVFGFPRKYRKGPPQGDGVTRESFMFWSGMLMNSHYPIVRRFERYPYLNAILGRERRAGESEWIRETGHFGEATEDVARRVKEDVEAGSWAPLGTDSGLGKTPTAD